MLSTENLLTETSDLNLMVTWSVTPAQDVAETIVTTAEKGREAQEKKGVMSSLWQPMVMVA